MRGPIASEDGSTKIAERGAAPTLLSHYALREGAKEGLGMSPHASVILYNKGKNGVAASVARGDRSLRNPIGIELHILY
jgi:hypothetical protein